MRAFIFFTIALLASGCELPRQTTQIDAPTVDVPFTLETKSVDVTVCDLKNDPAKYNRKLVKLSGYFSRGFEVSDLYDPECRSKQVIWVEIGGVSPERMREEELEVEGKRLPLKEDAVFKTYDELLEHGKNVKATVIGTFFSGKKTEIPGVPPRTFYMGFGHMGVGSLLVIQEVHSAEPSKIKNKRLLS